ncbi:MAG: bifunctional folylpolyglutamate synthase/dihydrofolate synthase [Methanobacteriota archaeon]
MDYEATLQELYRLERFGIKLGLDNIRRLLELLGDPHRGLRAVHVTGTNGKGSVSAYAASALKAAGYRVGLYTSPHLIRFNERIRVDGEPIADADVLRLWHDMQPAVTTLAGRRRTDHPTFFEVTTAMAFQYFLERRVDAAVVEVGMGGRMDATNVIDGLVAVLTRIGLEHTEHLGKTVTRIAREKAGIIKPGARVVTVDQETLPAIQARCTEVSADLTVVGRDVDAKRLSQDLRGQRVRVAGAFGTLDVETPLLGSFQVENVGLAVAALAELRSKGFDVPDRAIVDGIGATRWSARLQVVRERPTVLVDGAHNGPAIRALAQSVEELLPGRRFFLVTGVLEDKDLAAFAESLGPRSKRVFACRPKSHRAFPAEQVAAAFRPHVDATVVPAVGDGIDEALREAGPDDVVLITGSIYTAGEALAHLGTGA